MRSTTIISIKTAHRKQRHTMSRNPMRYIVIYQNYLYSFHSIDHSAKYSIYLVGLVLLSKPLMFLLYLLFYCIILQTFPKVNSFCEIFISFKIFEILVMLFLFIFFKRFSITIHRHSCLYGQPHKSYSVILSISMIFLIV